MIKMIEKRFLSVYRDLGARRDPAIRRVNSIEELLSNLFKKDFHSTKVLFQPWSYCTHYSRPATFEDGSESRILNDQFETYAKLYNFDHKYKSTSDALVESIYEDLSLIHI